jgi:heat shock protein HtpX
MRLTSSVGLGVRALCSAGLSCLVLLLSAFTLAAAGGAFLLGAPIAVGIETGFEDRPLSLVAVAAVPVVPCFVVVVVRAIRLERLTLLDGTVPLAKEDNANTRAVDAAATRIAAQFGISKPRIRIQPDRTPFAYATYRPGDPVVAVRRNGSPIVVLSKGLIETLSERELEAVLAHEVAHLSNDDLQLTSWLLVPLFAAEFLHDDGENPGTETPSDGCSRPSRSSASAFSHGAAR